MLTKNGRHADGFAYTPEMFCTFSFSDEYYTSNPQAFGCVLCYVYLLFRIIFTGLFNFASKHFPDRNVFD